MPQNKTTRTSAPRIPSNRGRLAKKDKKDLTQPINEVPQNKKGSQLRPGTSIEPSVKGIPDLNISTEVDISMDVCAHVRAKKLNRLAPAIGSSSERVEALEESSHEEIAINYVTVGEFMNRTTTNVDIYFTKKIATIICLNPEPASLAECKKRSYWEN